MSKVLFNSGELIWRGPIRNKDGTFKEVEVSISEAIDVLPTDQIKSLGDLIMRACQFQMMIGHTVTTRENIPDPTKAPGQAPTVSVATAVHVK